MGYAVHDRDRKTYALGQAILPPAERFMAQQPAVRACRPNLEDIAQATGETASAGRSSNAGSKNLTYSRTADRRVRRP